MHRGGIRAIFWGSIFRQMASSTVGLFIPIYVYELGFELVDNSFIIGVWTILFFLFIWRMSCLLTCLFVEKLIDTIGFRRTLLLSSFLLICNFVSLMLAKNDLAFLWIAAVLGGMVTSTYWIARHALFGQDENLTHIGTTTGIIIVFSRIATILGPVVGGLVGTLYGFQALFSLGLVLIIFSSVPYFFMHHHHPHHPDGLLGLVDKIRDRRNFSLMLAWFGSSWDSEIAINFWPLYVFLNAGTLASLGFITSLVSIGAMILSYFSGFVYDRTKHRNKVFVMGAILTAIIWPIKSIARTMSSILLIDSLQNLSISFYSIPFLSQTYRFAFHRDPVAFFAFREIIWSIGVIALIVVVFFITLSWSWMWLFILASIGIIFSIALVFYHQFEI